MAQAPLQIQPLHRPKYPAWLWVLCIFLLALTVRLVAFAELYNTPFFQVLLGDAQGYDLWAQKIAAGDWKGGDQVFYQAPAYPYFLAVIYKILGHSPIGVRVIQCFFGALAAAMLAHAGRRFFGTLAGLFAGLIYAFFPIAVFYDLTLQKSSLDGLFMALLLFALSELYARNKDANANVSAPGVLLWSALIGIGSGLLILTRENALALVPVLLLLVPWFASVGGIKSRALGLLGFATATVLVLSPVAIRNHAVSGEWVLTTSQAGPNFYMGNHDGADGTYQPLKPGRGSYRYERADAIELAQKATGKQLSATEVSRYWMDQSTAYIRENPAAWSRLMARKTGLIINSLEAGDTEDPYTYADYSWTLRLTLAFLSMGTLLGLAVVALITPGGKGKPIYAISAIVLVFAASVVAFYVFGRYRFPMAPGLALLAGYGLFRVLDLLGQWLAPASEGGESCSGAHARLMLMFSLAGFLCIWGLASLPLLDRDGIKAVTYNNVASELLEQKMPPLIALPLLKQAIDLSPKYASSYSNLGAVLEQTSGPAGAALAYAKAVTLMPELSAARYNLARVQLESGQPAKAVETLDEGIAREPANMNFWSLKAKALMRSGQGDKALQAVEKAASLTPDNPDILNSLGVIQAQNNLMDQAQQSFARAERLNPRHPSARFNRARALIALNRINDSISELKEHLANYPDDTAARELLDQLTQQNLHKTK